MHVTAADIERQIDRHRAPWRRAGLIVLAGAGLLVGTLVGSLVVTEPEPLPTTTTVALSLVTVGGFTWTAYALWQLTRRTPLLLPDRVVGAAIACVNTLVAATGGGAIAIARGEPVVAGVIAILGATLLTLAVMLLRRAVTARRRARERLRELQSVPPAG